MDEWTINCLQEYTGIEVFQSVGANPTLLIELDGNDSEVAHQAEKLEAWISKESLAYRFAADDEQAEILWEVRRQGSSAMKKLAPTKLNEDIVVPLDQQIELVRFVNLLREDYHLKIGVFGHCGDGNLHVNFMYDEENRQETARSVEALSKLMNKVIGNGR